MSYSNSHSPHSKPTSHINLNSFNYASDPLDSLDSLLTLNCTHPLTQGNSSPYKSPLMETTVSSFSKPHSDPLYSK